MNRGSLGILELNVRLQTEPNPARADEPIVEKLGWAFRVRDKVIHDSSSAGTKKRTRTAGAQVLLWTSPRMSPITGPVLKTIIPARR
jgi:hypothetical protein